MAHGDLQLPRRPRYPDPPGSADPLVQRWMADMLRILAARDREVNTALTLSELSGSFAIDSTGNKTVTVANVFGFIPEISHCVISIVEATDVDDWAYNLLKVESVSATNIVGRINVSTASATGAATATMIFWVRP